MTVKLSTNQSSKPLIKLCCHPLYRISFIYIHENIVSLFYKKDDEMDGSA